MSCLLLSCQGFQPAFDMDDPSDSRSSIGSGRYLVRRRLGKGGMASVYEVEDSKLGVGRAIKVLAPHLAHHPKILRRFDTEARTMARLRHPHVVMVHDIGAEGTEHFIVMELMAGGSLWDLVEATGPISPEQTGKIGLATLGALHHAHENGVVHRDVKPQNVLLSEGGIPSLSDFGIARVEEQSRHLTRTGVAMGTWAFMPPEQRSNARAADARADIFSTGATLYTIATGEEPFDINIQEARSQMLARLPEWLAGVIERATRYDPDERYPSAREMAAELRSEMLKAGVDPDQVAWPLLRSTRNTITPSLTAADEHTGASLAAEKTASSLLQGQGDEETRINPGRALGEWDTMDQEKVRAPRTIPGKSGIVLGSLALVTAASLALGIAVFAGVGIATWQAREEGAKTVPVVEDRALDLAEPLAGEAAPPPPEVTVEAPPLAEAPVDSKDAIVGASPTPASASAAKVIESGSTPPRRKASPDVASESTEKREAPPVVQAPVANGSVKPAAESATPSPPKATVGLGYLLVNSRPQSSVTLDGAVVGQGAWRGSVSAGPHHLHLSTLDAAKTKELDVTAVEGEDVRVCWNFHTDSPC